MLDFNPIRPSLGNGFWIRAVIVAELHTATRTDTETWALPVLSPWEFWIVVESAHPTMKDFVLHHNGPYFGFIK
jgi:hypothetical protein